MSRYATLADLKEFVQIVDTLDDGLLETAIAAAETQIDQWCRRRFDVPVVATERLYATAGATVLAIDDAIQVDAVEVRPSISGSYVAVTFEEGPLNAAADGWPYTELFFARPVTGRVKVTAEFGWPEVPDTVKQATLLQASRLAQRRNAQFGIATVPGLDGTGIRLLSKLDADVELLLAPVRRRPVLVG